MLKPELIIPVHYNCGAMFNKCYNPADGRLFKAKAEEMGVNCVILQKGESTEFQWVEKAATTQMMFDKSMCYELLSLNLLFSWPGQVRR